MDATAQNTSTALEEKFVILYHTQSASTICIAK